MLKRTCMIFAAVLVLALSSVSADAQKKGGVLKFATPSVKPGLDPARTRTGDGYMLTAMIFSNLTRISPELKPEPQLAHKWEPNSDSTEWTFHLRKDAKFSNVYTSVICSIMRRHSPGSLGVVSHGSSSSGSTLSGSDGD